MTLVGDMNGCEVPAPVESGEHDGIEAVGLAVIAGFSGDEGRSDHLAGEAIGREDTLEHEACAGSLVAASEVSLIREAAKEPTYVHEVTGKLDHLGDIALWSKNGCRDGIGMHV